MFFGEKTLALSKIKFASTKKANTHSALLRALNTKRPIPKPSDKVTPGARNLSHASIKLMAPTKPIHIKTDANATGYFMEEVKLKVLNWFADTGRF